ncbi:hypothetical protein J6590_094548 [Homalodisca vitripennis]|nr:hypothetical protein J6590_094548 [Homalodisca vitripennis]
MPYNGNFLSMIAAAGRELSQFGRSQRQESDRSRSCQWLGSPKRLRILSGFDHSRPWSSQTPRLCDISVRCF